MRHRLEMKNRETVPFGVRFRMHRCGVFISVQKSDATIASYGDQTIIVASCLEAAGQTRGGFGPSSINPRKRYSVEWAGR